MMSCPSSLIYGRGVLLTLSILLANMPPHEEVKKSPRIPHTKSDKSLEYFEREEQNKTCLLEGKAGLRGDRNVV